MADAWHRHHFIFICDLPEFFNPNTLLNRSWDMVFAQCLQRNDSFEKGEKKGQRFQCSVSVTSAAQLETLLKGH